MEKPGRGRSEPASVEVEGPELLVEVHFHPLASCSSRLHGGDANQFAADAAPLMVGPHLRVDQEGMVAAVSGDVHEAHEPPIALTGRHPAEAVRSDAIPPTHRRPASVGPGQIDKLVVTDLRAPRKEEIRKGTVGRHSKKPRSAATKRSAVGPCGR